MKGIKDENESDQKNISGLNILLSCVMSILVLFFKCIVYDVYESHSYLLRLEDTFVERLNCMQGRLLYLYQCDLCIRA